MKSKLCMQINYSKGIMNNAIGLFERKKKKKKGILFFSLFLFFFNLLKRKRKKKRMVLGSCCIALPCIFACEVEMA